MRSGELGRRRIASDSSSFPRREDGLEGSRAAPAIRAHARSRRLGEDFAIAKPKPRRLRHHCTTKRLPLRSM
jgi:hypothetical protein